MQVPKKKAKKKTVIINRKSRTHLNAVRLLDGEHLAVLLRCCYGHCSCSFLSFLPKNRNYLATLRAAF